MCKDVIYLRNLDFRQETMVRSSPIGKIAIPTDGIRWQPTVAIGYYWYHELPSVTNRLRTIFGRNW